MKFTDNQLLAIHHHGEDILVSAGAGSGKTAVLSQRVISLLEEGIDIDRLIVLTFTNAAAAEMKSRIKDEILKNTSLLPQLKHLDNAVISTFDSFALRIVNEFHYLSGLPDGIRIVDSALLWSVKEKIWSETMDVIYTSADPIFLRIADRLFDKGDGTFRDAVLTLCRGLETTPNRMAWLDACDAAFFGPDRVDSLLFQYEELLDRKIRALRKLFNCMVESFSACRDVKISDFLVMVSKNLSPLEKAQNLDDKLSAILGYAHPNFPRLPKDILEIWGAPLKAENERFKKAASDVFDEVRKLFAVSGKKLAESYLETRETVLTIVSVAKAYLSKLDAYKRLHNLFDFSDVMDLAISLLEHHLEPCARYKDRIGEILVDEYQDTNDLQEYLLHLLGRKNLFMVGDVKQSIYGFRNANPVNFIRKYHQFDADQNGKTIDLLENFRSRKETIDGINHLFEDILDEKMGGVDYKKRQALVPGNEDYPRLKDRKYSYEPQILTYQDEEGETRPKAYQEGLIIASDIKKRMDSGFLVFDIKDKILRKATWGDFSILTDRKSGFVQYQKALVDSGIPVAAITDEKFVASAEILFVNNALRFLQCLADPEWNADKFRPVFYGTARSFVYRISDEEVVSTLIRLPSCDRDAFLSLNIDRVFGRLFQDLVPLAEWAHSWPIEELLTELYRRTAVLLHSASLPDPAGAEAKLLFLLKKARELPEFGLDELVEYFEALYASEDLDVEYSHPFETRLDAVKMMTIHKSKGLEFPVCYFPGLDKRFNLTDSKAFFVFDKRYGLVTKAWDDGFQDTFVHALLKEDVIRDALSERIRLFYVATTRTREQMVFVLNITKDEVPDRFYNLQGYLDESLRMKYRSFKNLLVSVPITATWRHEAEISFSIGTNIPHSPLTEGESIQYFRIEKFAKLDVGLTYSKSIFVLPGSKARAAMISGERIHAELERFDFHHLQASLSAAKPEIRKTMQGFLELPEFQEIGKARIYQEYEFSDETPEGRKSGIIDLAFEYPDRIDVVDFKLKSLDDEAYDRQLAGYADFLWKVTKKPVWTYLFSIRTGTLVKMGGKS